MVLRGCPRAGLWVKKGFTGRLCRETRWLPSFGHAACSDRTYCRRLEFALLSRCFPGAAPPHGTSKARC